MKITRRKCAFWVGFGLFSLSERFNAVGLDRLAAAAMESTDSAAPAADVQVPIHWQAAENNTWRWFEREHYVDGQWKLTGITTPINKRTGEPYTGKKGYLDDDLVPDQVRFGHQAGEVADEAETIVEGEAHPPDPARRARHGRPPSRWLRSLRAEEIRIWLKTIDVPEAGVEGMTFYEHLTRDHSFDPDRIAGLSLDEQAKLHAAAHHGY